jgi:hypothetical protein
MVGGCVNWPCVCGLVLMKPTERVFLFSAFVVTRYCQAAGLLRCHG